jgi:hypothetical protein
MPAALNIPAGVAFVEDEHHGTRISSSPTTYYGGRETFSRARTYSGVRQVLHATYIVGSSYATVSHHKLQAKEKTIVRK